MFRVLIQSSLLEDAIVFETFEKIINITNILETISNIQNLPNTYDPLNLIIKHNGKLLSPKILEIELNSRTYINSISIELKLCGGIFGGDDIIDSVMSAFSPIIEPIKKISFVFVLLFKIVMVLIKIVIWTVQFIIWFLIDFCNPVNLANDFIGGILKITRLIFAVISDAIFGLAKYVFNMVLSPIFSGFWGWDNVPTPEEKAAILEKAQNEMETSGTTIEGDLKVFDPPDGKVPFTVILATILMPPMGLFMEFGLSGWVNIVICAILTLGFYFPGLIYALMLIYS